MPASPVHSWRKLSHVLGQTSLNNSTVTRPTAIHNQIRTGWRRIFAYGTLTLPVTHSDVQVAERSSNWCHDRREIGDKQQPPAAIIHTPGAALFFGADFYCGFSKSSETVLGHEVAVEVVIKDV
jgi:hypothetical protein